MQVILLILLAALLVLVSAITLGRFATYSHAKGRIFNIDNAPSKPAAIVFGAGLRRDGTPTSVLRDRVSTAVQLYKAGKISKILMSGDNRFNYYNEPGAMKEFAIDLGIPEEAIVLDYAGRRTYDTCYRARDIFGLREVILVTQNFHLPRALFTCNSLGVSAVGVSADSDFYRRRSQIFWNIREVPATIAAFWHIYISKPTPVLGNPEPIFPLEAQ
ncbi:MAG: vancomycin high temperature exclusion protein [Anaerolineales bacterium]|jgi:SanA protein